MKNQKWYCIYNYSTNKWRVVNTVPLKTEQEEILVVTLDKMPTSITAVSFNAAPQIIPIINNDVVAALNTFSEVDDWDSYLNFPFNYA